MLTSRPDNGVWGSIPRPSAQHGSMVKRTIMPRFERGVPGSNPGRAILRKMRKTAYREIRADFDRSMIVVYQAYNGAIADAALEAQKFVSPFSVNRMTWIKPSFLWLMERSGWGTKSNQERTLAVRITRAGWDCALGLGTLTAFDPAVHASIETWRTQFASSAVHIQWDPERSLQGGKLDYRSIQVGLSRAVIERFVSEWTVGIMDLSPLVAKLRQLRKEGKHAAAKKLLPSERLYPANAAWAAKLGIEL